MHLCSTILVASKCGGFEPMDLEIRWVYELGQCSFYPKKIGYCAENVSFLIGELNFRISIVVLDV